MTTDAGGAFRDVYWQAVRELDTVRLRLWESSGLTLPQLRVLFQARRQPGITTRDLARTMGITVSTTSGLVSRLVERGLIERSSDLSDRRLVPLRLTAAGASLTGELSGAGRAFLDAVAAELGAELPAVTAALAALAAAASRARAAEPAVTPAEEADAPALGGDR